ncbi:hypothetical protein [Actinacidiphila rubida]|uniref:hypothetical protein n=1 Tax=Actinacidiphila rubida TaxID=310780 RepID=UPI00159EF8D8|nr:hypothetical protein [Actinacidiphila rubida]
MTARPAVPAARYDETTAEREGPAMRDRTPAAVPSSLHRVILVSRSVRRRLRGRPRTR